MAAPRRGCLDRSMNERISIGHVAPAAYQAMLGLETYLGQSGLTPLHRDLIKLRASQINGCAYCIDSHVAEALEHGADPRQLHLLSVWREDPRYDAQERAILALTEEATRLQNGVSDATYDAALAALGEKYLAATIVAIAAINAWNRIGVTTRMRPASTQV
jgi:AhpD family alkylhydroperoxidase